MVTGFIGDMGAGKSLAMCYYIFKHFNSGGKRELWTNFWIKTKYKFLSMKSVKEFVLNPDKKLRLCCIDEIGQFFNSRSWQRNKDITQVVTALRKANISTFYTAQWSDQMDKWWRNSTSMLVEPRLIKKDNGEPLYMTCKWYQKQDNVMLGKTEFKEVFTDVIDAKVIKFLFKQYDTKDISMFEDAQEFMKEQDFRKDLRDFQKN